MKCSSLNMRDILSFALVVVLLLCGAPKQALGESGFHIESDINDAQTFDSDNSVSVKNDGNEGEIDSIEMTGGEEKASDEDVFSNQNTTYSSRGVWGTCPWEISLDGILTIYPGIGVDTHHQSPWGKYYDEIRSIRFIEADGDKVVLPEDCSGIFDSLNVASVDLSSCNSSNVTCMSFMFYGCTSLTSLDLSGWDTSSVTKMSYMFCDCTSLASLDLSGWDTSSVTDMCGAFSGCSSLSSLDLSSWNTSRVTDMNGINDFQGMFHNCSSLTSLDIAGWNTRSLTSLFYMFSGCSSLTSLDLSGWNTSRVTKTDGMFSGCSSLTSLDLSGWNTHSVESANDMYSGCSSLSRFIVGRDFSCYVVYELLPKSSCEMGWWSVDHHSWITEYDLHENPSSIEGTYISSCIPGYEIDISSLSIARINGTAFSDNAYCPKYTGEAFSPTVEIRYSILHGDGSKSVYTLVMGRDYDLEYVDNVGPGLATIIVTGKGNYAGTKKVQFKIMGSLNDTTITNLDEQVYTGKQICPKLNVTYNDKLLTENNDYILSYNNNTKPGIATATAIGKGCFTGSKQVTFRIVGNLANANVDVITNKNYSGKPFTPKPDVRFADKELVEGTDFEFKYTDNVNVGTAKVSIVGKGLYIGSKTVSFEIVPPIRFPDVKNGAWYERVVNRAVDFGIISGYADGSFGPDNKITRGQVVVILWRMAGRPSYWSYWHPWTTFYDVDDDAYYYSAVCWASAAGVVNGFDDGGFGPDKYVTREQLAAMLANYTRRVAEKSVSGSATDFEKMKDADKVAKWAQLSVGWCFRNKILSGSNGYINPKGNASRAEAAKMFVALYDLVK